MRFRSCLVSAFFLGLVGCAHPGGLLDSQDWPRKTREDAQTIHDTIVRDHPAGHQAVPPFRDWLEGGLKTAREDSKKVTSFAGYYFALRRYANRFHDGHLTVSPVSASEFAKRISFRWPGFLVGLRAGKYVVVTGEGVSMGSELVSCDGRGPELLMKENVFPYYGNPEVESQWQAWAPRILLDSANPFIQLPESCDFKKGDTVETHRLSWKSIANPWPALERAEFGSPPSTAFRVFGNGSVWISLPSFDPEPAQEKILKAMLTRRLEPSTSIVVFDLRGNTGGDSKWGTEVARSLLGAETIAWAESKFNSRHPEKYSYRVSKDNVAYFQGVVERQKRTFGGSPYFESLVSSLSRALARRKAFHQQSASASAAPPARHGKLPGRIFLLTDGNCASACLSFMDLMLELPGVHHIGTPTGADSIYLESRKVELSGTGLGFQIPMLQIKNRKRRNNAAYAPDIPWEGDISDTTGIESWIPELSSP